MENIYLRVADASDMDLIFQWANEPLVRKNSFSTREITYKEHVDGDIAEIGYSICKDQRAHGYGKELLRMITEQAWKDFPNISKVIGKIKPENTASLKAFSSAGYKETYKVYEIRKSDRL